VRCNQATEHDFGNSALHSAAAEGDAEIVRELLKTGADLKAQNTTGFAPLHLASMHKNKGRQEEVMQVRAQVLSQHPRNLYKKGSVQRTFRHVRCNMQK
jgi:ankyrin repeat protein